MSFRKLRALVIEDEAPIRKELIKALNETIEFEVVGESDSLEDGFILVKNESAEVLFLDIELLGGTAFQLLNLLKRQNLTVPPVVICTGYTQFEYAQKILNDHKDEVIFILKKPFYEDWEKHQEKIIDAIYLLQQKERMTRKAIGNKRLIIPDGRQSYLVNPDDVIMIKTGAKSQGKTEVILPTQPIGCNLSLSQLLARLPTNFVQVNRYEVINMGWITMIDHTAREVHLRNGDSCMIGSAYYQGLTDWEG